VHVSSSKDNRLSSVSSLIQKIIFLGLAENDDVVLTKQKPIFITLSSFLHQVQS